MSDAQQQHLNQSDIPFGDGRPGGSSAPPAPLGRGPLPRGFVRDYRKTLLECLACLLFFALLPPLSIVMFFLAPAYLAWASFTLLVIWFRADRREWYSVRLILWTITLAVSAGLIVYNTNASRARAHAVAADIEGYRAAHGRYPGQLQDAGITQSRFIHYYNDGRDAPSLMYFSATMPFSRCFYDFPSRKWDCPGD